MAAATDSHWSPAAGTQTSSASSSSSASWDPWSPSKPPTAGKKLAWPRPTAASPSVDAGSWPALPAGNRSPSSAPINPAIGGDAGELATPVRVPVMPASSEPPAVRGDHGPRPRSFAPRGGYNHHHRRNYSHHGNFSRPRRDNYGHNYHHPRPHLRPPVFNQPIALYPHPHFGNYPAMVGYGDVAPFQILYVPTMPTVTYPAPPQQVGRPSLWHLRSAVLRQVEFYFSDNNLCGDLYLRQNMDEEGWVSISLIAGFKRMKVLNMDIPFILDAVRNSNVVEVKGHKIRPRIDPLRWLLPPSFSTDIQQFSSLESEMKNMELNEGSSSQVKIASS